MKNLLIRLSKNFKRFFIGTVACLFSSQLLAADAATGTAPGATDAGSGMMSQLLLLAVFAFALYFMILRPQSKRAKQQRDLISGLQKGDEVITAGGILGRIQRVKDDFIVLGIAEGTEILIQKQAIAGTLPKGTMKDIAVSKAN